MIFIIAPSQMTSFTIKTTNYAHKFKYSFVAHNKTSHSKIRIPIKTSKSLKKSSSSKSTLSSSSSTRIRAIQELKNAEPVVVEAKPVVLVAEKLGKAGMDLLQKYTTVDCTYEMTNEQLKEKIKQSDAIIIRSASKITREIFEAANGHLKVVGRAGVGVDNIDLGAATEFGCLVVNAPTANIVAAAEHGVSLLCAMARNIPDANVSMKNGEWKRSKYVGTSLSGKTVGIMGFGKVGLEVAKRLKGLGMNVIAHDPYASEEKARAMGIKLVHFDEALAKSDFFSLHMPLTPSTRKMFNDAAFEKMKKGARIINVARGGVIDDDALARALDKGIVAQAALDVFESEPPKSDNPVIKHPNVICTPHLGASTSEAQEGVSIEVVEAVVAALRGDLVTTAINAPILPPEILKELRPYVSLAEGLGRAAVQLVGDSGFDDISICYSSPRGDDLDTRLLRAMVIKGIIEQISEVKVNLVNADLISDNRGLNISEVTVKSGGRDVLSSMSVAIKAKETNFKASLDEHHRIYLEGTVKGTPIITKIGKCDVELLLEGYVILVEQIDQPGIIANLCAILAKENINVSFMTVCRLSEKGGEAVMAIGVDDEPSDKVKKQMPSIKGVIEVATLGEM